MKIALLGDIAFFGKFCAEANPSVYDYLKDVADYLGKFDIVIGNLETPFSSVGKQFGSKSAYIRSNPDNISILKYLHVSHVNLSNNHIFDFGKEGYLLTKRLLGEAGIGYFGIEDKTEFISDDSNSIALHGYCCYSTNPIGPYKGHGIGIDMLSVAAVTGKMKRFKDEGYFNIVSVHAGEEHVNFPNYHHMQMARKFASEFDCLYYGHHPHVLQGIEKVGNSLVAHSLGNFCFDDIYTSKSKEPLIRLSENNKESVILEVELENNQIVSYKTTGIYMNSDRMDVNVRNIAEKVEGYSAFLSTEKQAYIDARSLIIRDYIQSRKQLRNMNWYVRRLNLNSVRMIVNGRRNVKMYHQSVVDQL